MVISVVTLKYTATRGLFPSCRVYQDRPEGRGVERRGREEEWREEERGGRGEEMRNKKKGQARRGEEIKLKKR
jgi:hypothetical protein